MHYLDRGVSPQETTAVCCLNRIQVWPVYHSDGWIERAGQAHFHELLLKHSVGRQVERLRVGLSCQIPLLLLVIDFGNTYSHNLLYALLLPLVKH